MKKSHFILFSLLLSVHILSAVNLGIDTYNSYHFFLPEERLKGNAYPESWIIPDALAKNIAFYDSSYSQVRWDRFLSPVRYGNNLSFNESNHLTAVYAPASTGIRWGAAMDWLDYTGPSPVNRHSVNARINFKKLDISLYQTSHEQSLDLTTLSSTATYDLSAAGTHFIYSADSLLTLSGDLSYFSIDQEDSIAHTNSQIRQTLSAEYLVSPRLTLSTDLIWRHTFLDSSAHILTAMQAGGKYRYRHFTASAGMYISPNLVFPEISLGIIHKKYELRLFSKVEEPSVAFNTENGCVGLKARYTSKGPRLKHSTVFIMSENLLNTPAGISPRSVFKAKEFISLKLGKSLSIYANGDLRYMPKPMPCVYYPEFASWQAGVHSHSSHVHGNLILDVNLYGRQIFHDDPDKVHFNTNTLTYSRENDYTIVSDWIGGADINASVKELTLGLSLSTPLRFDSDFLNYSLVEGIYTSSDFTIGNIFYAALNINWYWWR